MTREMTTPRGGLVTGLGIWWPEESVDIETPVAEGAPAVAVEEAE